MSVSEPFIRRPIATSLLGIALLIGGALGYWALPVSALPQVDFPTVQVTTQLPGASPDEIASLITAPLERQLGQIPSLSSMTSTSSFGISQISGVGGVSVLGGLKPAVRVQADLARLAAYGIAMEDLRNAIAGANVSGPKGSLDGAQQAYTIAANDQIAAAEAYKPIIIAYRNGSPVTIGDVAIIVDGLENDRTGGWYQGTPAVLIDIQR